MGAVLLQWEEGEVTPRPVCFLSRKLQGAQYRYDARNVEALAAQVALAAWRPLLYGVKFELLSDHSSLTHLFTQKAPSQRILRMCEFFEDFDFDTFWQTMRQWSKHNLVFISEYEAPKDFVCVWEKKMKTCFNDGDRKKRTEKLFMYKL